MSEEKFHLTDEIDDEISEGKIKSEKNKENKEEHKIKNFKEENGNKDDHPFEISIDNILKNKKENKGKTMVKKAKKVNITNQSQIEVSNYSNILYDDLINSISDEENNSSDKNEKNKKGKNKKNESFLKKMLFSKTDIILYISNFSAIILYHYALTPCEKDASECTIKRGMIFYFTIGIFTAISSILYAIYISITLYKKKYWIHYLYTLPIFFYYIHEYTGADSYDHGFYNAFGWIGVIILFVPITLLICYIIELIKSKRFKMIGFIFGSISTIIIIYYNLPGFSCDYWDLGLNNTRIYNDEDIYGCEIMLPGKDKCYLKKMDGFFDFSKMFRPSCQADGILKQEKQILLESLSYKYFGASKLNHFGYPITTVADDRYGMYTVKDLKDFQDRINRNIIKMDLYNEENYPDEPKPEVEVFFDKNGYGSIKINVTKNETLSKERKIKAKDKHSLFNNVLIVYIDAISRNVFQRKLHKLAEYIEQFMPYNTNENEKKYTAFQFMKYHTLKGLTLPNIKSMFYGVSLDEADGINLVKFFKEQGYVTGHTGTTCGKEIFSVNGLLQMQHLDYDNWDHENIAMFCDPNFFDARYPIYKGVASVLKRCLYGNYAFEYMIEYAKQFWNKYPDNKKFFRIHFNEGHEGSMELVSYMADPFFEFVKYFFDNNLLNDTFMFIVSDHGNHMLGPWAMIRPQDYLLETTLATLCFVIPNNAKLYKNGLYDNIHNNQQTLVTPYDIHDTLIHIAYGTDKPDHMAFSTRGSSLLLYINPKERYCENPDLDYQIAKSDCKCRRYKD